MTQPPEVDAHVEAPSQEQIQTTATPDVVRGIGIVTVSGRLDAASLAEFRTAIDAVPRRRVILDLHLVAGVADVVHVLDLLSRYAQRHGSVLVVAGLSGVVQDALLDAGASTRYPTASTLTEALQGQINGADRSRDTAEEHDERRRPGSPSEGAMISPTRKGPALPAPRSTLQRTKRSALPPIEQISPLDLPAQANQAISVQRERLLQNLSELDDDVTLVFLAAGPGYGKTTLIRQWSEVGARAFTSLLIDGTHGESSQLARELARALLRVAPLEDILGPLLTSPDAVPTDEAASCLAAAARAIRGPVMLVLDDVHLLRSRTERELIAALAERLPRGSRIVATAVSRTSLPTARLSAQGQVLELGPQELVFTRGEAAAFLDLAGLGLSPQAVDEVFRRTEGWPAGLHLAAATLRRQGDPTVAAWTLAGDNQAFVDYFHQEVLSRLSAETVRFLVRSAVLDRMSASLCDTALDIHGSAAWLAELTTLGLQVVPLDDQGIWYRHSALFGEMLRAELSRREPGEDRRVLRRAAQWYEDEGLPEQAIGCAVAAGADITASRLIVANAHQLNSRGRIELVREWIDAIDEGVLELYPPLATTAAWVFALTGDAPQARHALGVAETATFEGPLPDGSSSFAAAVALAKAGLAPDGMDAMLPQAREAAGLEPPGSAWHTLATLLLGMAQWITGSPTDAACSFEQAFRYRRPEARPGAALALAESALLSASQHDWGTAEWCVREAKTLMDAGGMRSCLPGLVVTLASARMAQHRGNTQQALTETRRAFELYQDPSPNALPWLAVQAAVELGRLLLGLEDITAAEIKVIEARRHLRALSTVGVLPAWVDELAEDVEQAKQRTRAEKDTGLTKAELRVLQLLPTHLLLAQIADELIVARNTVKSQVASIYRKLDATNRAEAVERGHACGLLPAQPAPE